MFGTEYWKNRVLGFLISQTQSTIIWALQLWVWFPFRCTGLKMRRCVNLRKVPGWHLLEEGGGEKERGGERSGWSDAKTRNFLLRVVLEQTNPLSNVTKIFKEGKSRNWRKKWNWPLNYGVCTLKKAAQHIHRAGNPSHVLHSVFIQEETINEVPIAGSLIGVCTLTFTIWKHT